MNETIPTKFPDRFQDAKGAPMNGLPYYKRYPRDFIEGTVGMPFELKGAYAIVLDLIYLQRGKLPDDPHYISGVLGCSVRKWNQLRKQLIDSGKIVSENEIISNKRADKEEIILRKYSEQQAKKGRITKKNNDLRKSGEKPRLSQPEPEPYIDTATSVAASSRADLDELENQIRFAAGLLNDPSPSFFDLSEPLRWLENGFDLELDILSTLCAVRERKTKPRSWGYFSQAIADAHATRISPLNGKPQENTNGGESLRDSQTREFSAALREHWPED